MVGPLGSPEGQGHSLLLSLYDKCNKSTFGEKIIKSFELKREIIKYSLGLPNEAIDLLTNRADMNALKGLIDYHFSDTQKQEEFNMAVFSFGLRLLPQIKTSEDFSNFELYLFNKLAQSDVNLAKKLASEFIGLVDNGTIQFIHSKTGERGEQQLEEEKRAKEKLLYLVGEVNDLGEELIKGDTPVNALILRRKLAKYDDKDEAQYIEKRKLIEGLSKDMEALKKYGKEFAIEVFASLLVEGHYKLWGEGEKIRGFGEDLLPKSYKVAIKLKPELLDRDQYTEYRKTIRKWKTVFSIDDIYIDNGKDLPLIEVLALKQMIDSLLSKYSAFKDHVEAINFKDFLETSTFLKYLCKVDKSFARDIFSTLTTNLMAITPGSIEPEGNMGTDGLFMFGNYSFMINGLGELFYEDYEGNTDKSQSKYEAIKKVSPELGRYVLFGMLEFVKSSETVNRMFDGYSLEDLKDFMERYYFLGETERFNLLKKNRIVREKIIGLVQFYSESLEPSYTLEPFIRDLLLSGVED